MNAWVGGCLSTLWACIVVFIQCVDISTQGVSSDATLSFWQVYNRHDFVVLCETLCSTVSLRIIYVSSIVMACLGVQTSTQWIGTRHILLDVASMPAPDPGHFPFVSRVLSAGCQSRSFTVHPSRSCVTHRLIVTATGCLIATAVSASHPIEACLFCRYQKGESTSLPVWLNESYHTESISEYIPQLSVYTHVQQLSNASVVRGVVGADTNSSWLNTLLGGYHEK